MQIIKSPNWPKTESKIEEWHFITKEEKVNQEEQEMERDQLIEEIGKNQLQPITKIKEIKKSQEIPKCTEMRDKISGKIISLLIKDPNNNHQWSVINKAHPIKSTKFLNPKKMGQVPRKIIHLLRFIEVQSI